MQHLTKYWNWKKFDVDRGGSSQNDSAYCKLNDIYLQYLHLNSTINTGNTGN